jgi:hypothetical protein
VGVDIQADNSISGNAKDINISIKQEMKQHKTEKKCPEITINIKQ